MMILILQMIYIITVCLFQTDADPEVCKKMCRVNDFEAVLSLVSYYQMVSPSADDVIKARSRHNCNDNNKVLIIVITLRIAQL